MAQIVFAAGSSHGPTIQSTPDKWLQLVERDKRDPRYSFEEVLRNARPGLDQEIRPEIMQQRYKVIHADLDKLTDVIASVPVDVMQIKGDSGPSSVALNNANIKMHSAMDITYTGNSDVDFVKGMIPHHAGAIDMARVVLTYGKDPEIKKLAEGIIKAQEAEIAQMQAWLKKNGQ